MIKLYHELQNASPEFQKKLILHIQKELQSKLYDIIDDKVNQSKLTSLVRHHGDLRKYLRGAQEKMVLIDLEPINFNEEKSGIINLTAVISFISGMPSEFYIDYISVLGSANQVDRIFQVNIENASVNSISEGERLKDWVDYHLDNTEYLTLGDNALFRVPRRERKSMDVTSSQAFQYHLQRRLAHQMDSLLHNGEIFWLGKGFCEESNKEAVLNLIRVIDTRESELSFWFAGHHSEQQGKSFDKLGHESIREKIALSIKRKIENDELAVSDGRVLIRGLINDSKQEVEGLTLAEFKCQPNIFNNNQEVFVFTHLLLTADRITTDGDRDVGAQLYTHIDVLKRLSEMNKSEVFVDLTDEQVPDISPEYARKVKKVTDEQVEKMREIGQKGVSSKSLVRLYLSLDNDWLKPFVEKTDFKKIEKYPYMLANLEKLLYGYYPYEMIRPDKAQILSLNEKGNFFSINVFEIVPSEEMFKLFRSLSQLHQDHFKLTDMLARKGYINSMEDIRSVSEVVSVADDYLEQDEAEKIVELAYELENRYGRNKLSRERLMKLVYHLIKFKQLEIDIQKFVDIVDYNISSDTTLEMNIFDRVLVCNEQRVTTMNLRLIKSSFVYSMRPIVERTSELRNGNEGVKGVSFSEKELLTMISQSPTAHNIFSKMNQEQTVLVIDNERLVALYEYRLAGDTCPILHIKQGFVDYNTDYEMLVNKSFGYLIEHINRDKYYKKEYEVNDAVFRQSIELKKPE